MHQTSSLTVSHYDQSFSFSNGDDGVYTYDFDMTSFMNEWKQIRHTSTSYACVNMERKRIIHVFIRDTRLHLQRPTVPIPVRAEMKHYALYILGLLSHEYDESEFLYEKCELRNIVVLSDDIDDEDRVWI
jgi:hypothetical protein